MVRAIGWLLGVRDLEAIDSLRVSLASPWVRAGQGTFWLCLLVLAALAGSAWFYLRRQTAGTAGIRLALGIARGLLLSLLIVTLAEPVLEIGAVTVRPPRYALIFDGTDSMAIQDHYPVADRKRLIDATGLPDPSHPAMGLARMDLVRAMVTRSDRNLVRQLQEKGCRVEAMLFDGETTSQLRKIASDDERIDPQALAEQLTTAGQVTALGRVLHDLGQRLDAGTLSGVILFSDFAHNAGMAPRTRAVGDDSEAAIGTNVPIHAVGVGPTEAVDLAVDLQTEPKIRRGETTTLQVKLQQTGLLGREAHVRVSARALRGEQLDGIDVGERTVSLMAASQLVELPFLPREAGEFEFAASVEPADGEAVTANNRATRALSIIDDYVRLLYVAYEPTWEWRFVKEVFHRDPTVGLEGFRTYLASSDPKVRETNSLFLPTLTPPRGEFFANDVIFLDDVPQATLTPRFCELVREFVEELGGGLVVIAGPRFGPRQLRGTVLADMLPVILDPDARLDDSEPLVPRLTPEAASHRFMQLGDDAEETTRAWENLGPIPWYQPVAQVHERADVLAEHPTDTCAGTSIHQPLIAVRRFGSGEVVYLGFNETWRLRRRHGERYYRRFWSPLIDRLGMSHALGSQKRFVPRLDARQYRVDDMVTLSVQAYDENYEPLADEQVTAGLTAELTIPAAAGGSIERREFVVPHLRAGLFETRFPVHVPGAYLLRVRDPVTGEDVERQLEVASVSAERRSGVRNEQLQQELARATGGRACTLDRVDEIVAGLDTQPIRETATRRHALWSTPAWFALLVVLMIGEWLGRKLVRLT